MGVITFGFCYLWINYCLCSFNFISRYCGVEEHWIPDSDLFIYDHWSSHARIIIYPESRNVVHSVNRLFHSFASIGDFDGHRVKRTAYLSSSSDSVYFSFSSSFPRP